jgi:hypothetical protein
MENRILCSFKTNQGVYKYTSAEPEGHISADRRRLASGGA